MAKYLRDITPKVKAGPPKGEKQKLTKDHIDFVAVGEKNSKVVDGSTGTVPGVDYMPKDEMGQKFVKIHKVEKHEDRVGNGDEVYKGKTKEAPYQKQKDSMYESKRMKCESCGNMYEGESCGCGSSSREAKPGKKGMILGGKKLEEVLTKKTSVSKVISDFVHSDNPKFAGKSTKERQKMALGAYYGMHPEKSKIKEAADDDDDEDSQNSKPEKMEIPTPKDSREKQPGVADKPAIQPLMPKNKKYDKGFGADKPEVNESYDRAVNTILKKIRSKNINEEEQTGAKQPQYGSADFPFREIPKYVKPLPQRKLDTTFDLSGQYKPNPAPPPSKIPDNIKTNQEYGEWVQKDKEANPAYHAWETARKSYYPEQQPRKAVKWGSMSAELPGGQFSGPMPEKLKGTVHDPDLPDAYIPDPQTEKIKQQFGGQYPTQDEWAHKQMKDQGFEIGPKGHYVVPEGARKNEMTGVWEKPSDNVPPARQVNPPSSLMFDTTPVEKNKDVREDLAMPMLEGGKKKKMKEQAAPADTAMRFPGGNVGDTGRV